MITVVSVSPCVDYLLEVPGFMAGAHYRTEAARMIAAGKGTNVYRALAHMTAQEDSSMRVGLCGFGDTALYAPLLRGEGLLADGLVPMHSIRVNVTVADPESEAETHLKTPAAQIESEQREMLVKKFDSSLAGSLVVVLVGSLPPGLEEDFYAFLVKRAKAKGVHTVLDASGPAARCALEAGPTLAKPNRVEFSQFTGKAWDPRALDECLEFFGSKGVRYGVVSLGAKGAYLFADEQVMHCEPPEVEVVSSVGAGDVLVAGLAFDLAEHDRITKEGFRRSVAFATQSVGTRLPAYFDYQEGLRLTDKVALRSNVVQTAGRASQAD